MIEATNSVKGRLMQNGQTTCGQTGHRSLQVTMTELRGRSTTFGVCARTSEAELRELFSAHHQVPTEHIRLGYGLPGQTPSGPGETYLTWGPAGTGELQLYITYLLRGGGGRR